jgi:AcrR family transcriptional regulator
MARPLIKQEELEGRELELLAIARRLFLERGLEGMTMDRLASRTHFSKGTIYRLFSSREDVVAALWIQGAQRRLELFERAARFEGRSRERALALAKANYLFYRLDPDYWRTEQISHVMSVGTKISPQRKAVHDGLVRRNAELALQVIRQGVADGDLVLPKGLGPEQVLIGLLGFTTGLYLYASEGSPFAGWIRDPWNDHALLFDCACDGMGWRPFSKDWDSGATVARIWNEIFPSEAAILHERDAGPATGAILSQ